MLNINFNVHQMVPSFIHIVDRYCDPSWEVKPARHNFHNFIFVISGKGTRITDGIEYSMSPGTLVYHSPGQSFGYTTSETDLIHCYGVNFYLSSACCDDGVWSHAKVDQLPFNTEMKIPNNELLIKYLSNLTLVWNESKNNSQLKCHSLFLNILYELSRQLRQQQSDAQLLYKLECVTSYIHNHYNKNITLKHLADLVDFNPNYFSSVFKKSTDFTPVQYINYIRIEKACEYLSIGYSVKETAALVGYNDSFYFSKTFKKLKGISPSEYAKTPVSFC